MSIVARFFPNGEFSQGVDTSHKRRDNQRRHKDCIDKNWKERRDEYLRWKEEAAKAGLESFELPYGNFMRSRSGYVYYVEATSESSTTLTWEDGSPNVHTYTLLQSIHRVAFEWGLIPLVHQMVESCEKPESRKKLPSMTKHMARNIRNAVYLLERQQGGKDVLSFLTLTLPNLSAESLDICCQNWDKMVKRFFDWLRERLEACNIKLQHVYCTEIQTKRLEKRHEFAPHLHVVFRGRNGKKSPWVVTPKQVRKAWCRCIRAYVDEPFDSSALENIQRIKRSAARYLSKYLSKSTRVYTESPNTNNRPSLKTQWGGMARSLSRLVRQFTSRLTSDGEFREVVIYFVSNLGFLAQEGYILYYRKGFIPLSENNNEGTQYGLHVSAGCLSKPTCEDGLTRLLEFCQLQLISAKV